MATRRHFAWQALGIGAAANRAGARGVFNVADFSPAADGSRLDTAAIQSAIDACSSGGGGIVLLPPGRYLSSTVTLKSNVTLHLERGCTLIGSARLSDYPERIPALRSYTDTYTRTSLIYAENAENFAIEGDGAIDGQGAAFSGPYLARPYTMRIVGCRGVSVRGVTFRNSPMWVQHYMACEDVLISGVTVRSLANRNNDGIDIDACSRVRISDCDIVSGDDAIVLKSTLDRPCRDVVVSNCVLSTRCNAIKLGTESNGGFRNIAVNNCSVYDTRLAGIAVEEVDGGTLEGVSISNITMSNVACPIFVRLGDRGRPFRAGQARPPAGALRNVSISNVIADGANATGCSITGLPERPAENITLSNVRIRFAGGGTQETARRAVPEEREKYPEFRMFGDLPAHGFYCRHVRGLTLDNVHVSTAAEDRRPAFVYDDVTVTGPRPGAA